MYIATWCESYWTHIQLFWTHTDDDKQSVVNDYIEVKDLIPGHYCNIKLLVIILILQCTDYQNASVMGTQAQEQQEASYTNVYSTPFVDKPFDPLIPVTLPVPLTEMSTYVESCHSDYNRALHSQYEVMWLLNNMHSHFHLSLCVFVVIGIQELYCDEDNSLASVGFSIENIPRNRFKNITACKHKDYPCILISLLGIFKSKQMIAIEWCWSQWKDTNMISSMPATWMWVVLCMQCLPQHVPSVYT